MLFGWFYFDWTILIVLPAFFFSLWAQLNVSSTFKKYEKIHNARGITGAQAARRILDENGLYNVSIEPVRGHLTDHYDPRSNVIRLSESVYHNTSAAAVGVAAHEAGHAVQYAKGYSPIRLRAAIIPATRVGSMLSLPLFFIGLLMASDVLLLGGIALYALVALFQLVTLPVEFNASRRALAALTTHGGLSESDRKGAKKVLTAAAMTYVAALVTSFMQILYYLSRLNRRRD